MPDQNQTPEPREWVSTTCTLADGRRVQVEGHIVPLASSSLPDSGERAEALVDAEAVDDFTWRLIRAGMGLLGFDVRGELVSWLDGVLVRQPSSDGGEREAAPDHLDFTDDELAALWTAAHNLGPAPPVPRSSLRAFLAHVKLAPASSSPPAGGEGDDERDRLAAWECPVGVQCGALHPPCGDCPASDAEVQRWAERWRAREDA